MEEEDTKEEPLEDEEPLEGEDLGEEQPVEADWEEDLGQEQPKLEVTRWKQGRCG